MLAKSAPHEYALLIMKETSQLSGKEDVIKMMLF
jgi:hypothetical protein